MPSPAGKNNKNSKKTTRRALHYFWSTQWRHKGLTLGALISTPIVVLWRDVIFTYLLADIVAKVTENPSPEYIAQSLLPEAILTIVFRILFSTVLGELRIYWHWKMEINAIYHLYNLCFETIAAQSMQFHNDRFSGSLVSQTNKFVGAYERFMDELIWNVIPLTVTIIASLTILFTRVPLFAAFMTVFIIAFAVVAFLAFKKIAPLNEKMANADNKRTGQLADSITNITSVKSYANEKHERKRFEKFSKKSADRTTDLLFAELKRNIGFDFVYIGITALVLLFLIYGQTVFALSVGTLILVFQYSNTITGYLWNFNSIFKSMNRVFGDAAEMTEILDMEDDVVDLPNAVKLTDVKGEIKLNHISFKHQDAKEAIFEDFTLEVRPGERIGLVGISGSGKSTLTKLLLRFADVDSGTIEIDGQDIKHITQHSLRNSIAYVPQETALFHRSIAENIAYAKPSATQQEIEHAAKLASATDFINNLPDGYNTLVGERGIKLSGGQRQRIAIARAILKNAPILVLDEATSALDSESEAAIQSAMQELMKGRTSIVVAHRLSTVASLDRIVVLKDGKITEQGPHAELVRSGGEYSKLWSRQSGAFLE